MNVAELREQLLAFFPLNASVRVDVGGSVREIDHISLLHDGTDIVLIVPKEG